MIMVKTDAMPRACQTVRPRCQNGGGMGFWLEHEGFEGFDFGEVEVLLGVASGALGLVRA